MTLHGVRPSAVLPEVPFADDSESDAAGDTVRISAGDNLDQTRAIEIAEYVLTRVNRF